MVADTSSVTVETSPAGLKRLVINNQAARAVLYLQGAHLTSYQPRNQPDLLWVSQAEDYRPGKAIRGGIPICWPWFGAHPEHADAPSHGLVRTLDWEWTITHDSAQRTDIRLSQSTDGSNAAFPYRTRVELAVTVGETLELSLTTHNLDEQSLPLSQALHSYFPVRDLDSVNLTGLAEHDYHDKITGERTQWPSNFRIDREIDRILVDDGGVIQMRQTGAPNLQLTRSGSQSLVVWNPWADKSRTLSNFNNTDYRSMLCLESANVAEDARTLAPGDQHSLVTEIRLLPEPQ